jgi:ketosteroid isomerase-like protein
MAKSKLVGILMIVVLYLASTGTTMLSAQNQGDDPLLQTREAVWRAWFANDTKTLHALVPADTIVISGGEEKWKHQAEVFQSAADFQSKGGRLIRLQFQHTEVQHFGDVAIVWSRYLVETETNGRRTASSGRASEIFVRRDGQWTNPGWHTDSTK